LEKSLVATAAGAALSASAGYAKPTAAIDPVKLGPGQRLRIAILGCGARGMKHIQAINGYDNMEIVALCDIIPEKMDEKATAVLRGNPGKYIDYREMLKRDDIHGLVNATDDLFHKEGTVASLDAGIHVLSEKPMAHFVKDCEAMIEAADRNKKALMIGTQSRHLPAYIELEKRIRDGLIGNVLYAWANAFRVDWLKLYPDPEEDSKKNFRMIQERHGGIIFDQGIHTLDLFNWLIGSEPVKISCMGGVNNTLMQKRTSWDHAAVTVQYANNAVLNFGGNVYSCGGPGPDCLFGDQGTINIGPKIISYGHEPEIVKRTWNYFRPHRQGTYKHRLPKGETVLDLPQADSDPTNAMWGYFGDVMQGRKPPFPTGRDHLPAIQIARGALMSMEQERHIKASEVI